MKTKTSNERQHLRSSVLSLTREVPANEIPALASTSKVETLLDSDHITARFLFQVDEYLHYAQIALIEEIKMRVNMVNEEKSPLSDTDAFSAQLDNILLNSAEQNPTLARIIRDAWSASIRKSELLEYVFDELLNSKYFKDTERLLPLWQKFHSIDSKRRRVQKTWFLLITVFNGNEQEIQLPEKPGKAGKDMILKYIDAIEKLKMAKPAYDELFEATGIKALVWKRYLTDPAWILFLSEELKKKVGYRATKDNKKKILWQTAYAYADTLAYELAGAIYDENTKSVMKIKKEYRISDLPENYDFDKRRDGGKVAVKQTT